MEANKHFLKICSHLQSFSITFILPFNWQNQFVGRDNERHKTLPRNSSCNELQKPFMQQRRKLLQDLGKLYCSCLFKTTRKIILVVLCDKIGLQITPNSFVNFCQSSYLHKLCCHLLIPATFLGRILMRIRVTKVGPHSGRLSKLLLAKIH